MAEVQFYAEDFKFRIRTCLSNVLKDKFDPGIKTSQIYCLHALHVKFISWIEYHIVQEEQEMNSSKATLHVVFPKSGET
jgi:hypothetical protein